MRASICVVAIIGVGLWVLYFGWHELLAIVTHVGWGQWQVH
jgi:hypothetical protein